MISADSKPCTHLATVVKPLLEAGAQFVSVVPANGEVRFVHQLNRGPTPNIAEQLAVSHHVNYWRNRDSHYELDSGFVCQPCRLAVSWLQERETINAL